MSKDSEFTVYRDEYSKVPYLYSETKKEFYTYEDEISVKAKADFVKDEGFGGMILWEISEDTRADLGEKNSLLDVIHKAFYGDVLLKNANIVAEKTVKPLR
jgi:chitinase